MATQEFGDLTFKGDLNVILRRFTPLNNSDFTADLKYVGDMCYAIRKCNHPFEVLCICSPEICFKGKVAATACGSKKEVAEWKIGILQSISMVYGAACYTNDEVWRFRVSTGYGPVKDGLRSSLFYDPGVKFPTSSSLDVFECDVEAQDAPRLAFLTEFGGDPYFPHEPPVGKVLGRLERVGGVSCFTTFLAAVNEEFASVVTLAETLWTVVWDGVYDFDRRIWSPLAAEEMIMHRVLDQARKYENLRNPAVAPPFSLFLGPAEESYEIMTPKGWVSCSTALSGILLTPEASKAG